MGNRPEVNRVKKALDERNTVGVRRAVDALLAEARRAPGRVRQAWKQYQNGLVKNLRGAMGNRPEVNRVKALLSSQPNVHRAMNTLLEEAFDAQRKVRQAWVRHQQWARSNPTASLNNIPAHVFRNKIAPHLTTENLVAVRLAGARTVTREPLENRKKDLVSRVLDAVRIVLAGGWRITNPAKTLRSVRRAARGHFRVAIHTRAVLVLEGNDMIIQLFSVVPSATSNRILVSITHVGPSKKRWLVGVMSLGRDGHVRVTLDARYATLRNDVSASLQGIPHTLNIVQGLPRTLNIVMR